MHRDRLQSRRTFLAALTSGALLASIGSRRLLAMPGHVHTTKGVPQAAPWSLYIGTYTKTGTSRGIYHTTVDPASLAFGTLTLAAESADPSYLALTPDRRALVAVNELTRFEGQDSGGVSVFARDVRTDVLTALPPVRASRGAAPCYVSIDGTGRHVLVANYVGGNIAALPVGNDGALREASTVVAYTGKGSHPVRQTAPHAHCILLDRANRFVLSTDLGTDTIHVFRFDAASGALHPAAVPEVALAPGSGPRHLAFSPDGGTLYCVNELDSTLVTFTYDAATGGLRQRQRLSTRPAGASAENSTADLHVHPQGHTVYVSNRGDDTIAVFTVDATTKSLTLTQSVPTGGNAPRNFALTPDGAGLLVANQRSDSILAFRVDVATGRLSPTAHRIEAPVPVCLRFVPR